jgi:hypothetical protein
MEQGSSRREIIVGGMAAAGVMTVLVPAPAAAWTMTQGIPDSHVRPATRWLLDNYGQVLGAKVAGTKVPLSLACAIACQESAYTWFDRRVFKQGRTPAQMMRLLVLDNVSPRGAFPRDTSTFHRDRRFSDLAPALVEISDASRRARGYTATGNLLYGYGLFQYDLQNIQTDAAFWRDTAPGASVAGLWGDVGACADRFVTEMNGKLARHPGDLKAAISAYNGSGANARAYGEIVSKFMGLAQQEISAHGHA